MKIEEYIELKINDLEIFKNKYLEYEKYVDVRFDKSVNDWGREMEIYLHEVDNIGS